MATTQFVSLSGLNQDSYPAPRTITHNNLSFVLDAKVNKAKLRREIEDALFNKFIASGTEYSCLAVVINFCRSDALAIAKLILAAGINLSKSEYHFAWVPNMMDMFTMGAAKKVHRHFYPD